jgi:hypothetical protein
MLIYDAFKVGNRSVLIYWACSGAHLDFQFSMHFLQILNSIVWINMVVFWLPCFMQAYGFQKTVELNINFILHTIIV